MQERYGKDGLVCLSVSVDAPDRKAGVLAFLGKQKATFPNYLLDEDAAVWQNQWKIKGPPAVFVFDRAGKRAGKFDSDDPDRPGTPEDVENLVKQLLRQKP
jgi:hypothetical protein